MDNSKKSNWKLGAATAFFLVAIVFFTFYLGINRTLFTSTITLSGLFPDVSGMKPGNSVRIAGIEVGEVGEIEFLNHSLIRVYVVVEQESQRYIKSDAKLSLGSDGLLGDKVINIIKGSNDSAIVRDGTTLHVLPPFDTGKLLTSFQKTAANASIISKEFTKINRQLNGTNSVIGRYLNDQSFNSHLSATRQNFTQVSSDSSEPSDAKVAGTPKKRHLYKKIFPKKKNEEGSKKTEDDRVK